MEELRATIKKICEDGLQFFSLGMPKNSELFIKATIRPYGGGWQLEKRTKTQAFHENFSNDELCEKLCLLMQNEFNTLSAEDEFCTWSMRVSKKGKPLYKRTLKQKSRAAMRQGAAARQSFAENQKELLAQSMAHAAACSGVNHDRPKNHILPEGKPIAPLVEMGLMTAEGKIINSMRHKYRQINRFVELVAEAVKNEKMTEINIIDFGCGKSYLTFVIYYYFSEVLQLKVNMLGLDLRSDVIEKSREAAQKHGYTGLRFEVGDIAGCTPDFDVDIVICLHACDTATDHALANAVKWGARHIFALPCCQHELADQMKSEKLAIINRYGIIAQRTAALFTDALRANLLTAAGYKSQIIELVALSDTPKNLLIRASKANLPASARKKAQDEAQRLMEEFNLSPTLVNLLVASS